MRKAIFGAVAAIAAATVPHAYAGSEQYHAGPSRPVYAPPPSQTTRSQEGLMTRSRDRAMSGHPLLLVQQSAEDSPMVYSPRGDVPQTGAQQGVNTPNSLPLPSSTLPSHVRPSPSAPDVMVVSPSDLVPQTGAQRSVNTPNSLPPGSSTPR